MRDPHVVLAPDDWHCLNCTRCGAIPVSDNFAMKSITASIGETVLSGVMVGGSFIGHDQTGYRLK